VQSIDFIGEQLVWGRIGNLFIILAFTASLLSVFTYLKALRTGDTSWQKLARTAFAIHSLSIVGILGLLMFLIFNHRFEYYYVWEHSSTTMPLRYIFACLWEGQEGSFLLWMFWQAVLSWFIIRKAGEWENGVMFTISIAQCFIASMLLGVVILNYKIGSNPFILLREHSDFANLPFIKMPDYLSKISDGRGLNPLLQNYWMTIHPPTLFLGFASTIIPFAFAIAALLRRKFSEWVIPALPWTFFGVMILGTGILMGAAWAYEALSFGGFWAWDPVENASLVPWLTLVAASHVMIIYKSRQHSLLSAYLFVIATFILILYSTFLTRSGILGDTSVHAFTDLGMSAQLVIYMAFFIVFPVVLLIVNRKRIAVPQPDEHISSREFWMFIGVLVLLIGSLQITFTTSTPVINKLFGTKIAPPIDAIEHYNRWQVPVAIIICLLLGLGQFFKFKQTNMAEMRKKLVFSAVGAVLLTLAAGLILKQYPPQYYALLFASLFAVLANLDYMFRVKKGVLARNGSSIAHIGVALILMGALISNSKKEIISQNRKLIDFGKDFPNAENIMIEERTDTLPMGDYYLVYKGKEREGVNLRYTIEYYKLNKDGKKEKQFELAPVLQLNERMGNVAEPATKHFLTKDIYTHLTYAPPEDFTETPANEEWQKPKVQTIAIGDTFMTSNSFVVLEGLNKDIDRAPLHLRDSDIAVGARLRVEDINKNTYPAEPIFVIKNFEIYSKEAVVDSLGLKFVFLKIDPNTGKVEIAVSERTSNKKPFIIMKAIIFPGINILWTGCILLILGSILAIRKRIKQYKESKAKA
jgi:cytochrome c-type biogenesis protein CcmF